MIGTFFDASLATGKLFPLWPSRHLYIKDRRGERGGRRCEGVWGRVTGGAREVVEGCEGERIGG